METNTKNVLTATVFLFIVYFSFNYAAKQIVILFNPSSNLAQVSSSQATFAELPRVFLNTTYNAPTGNIINVPAGGNLQTAINSASCGDEIQLAQGATYTENIILPARQCANNMIHIRTAGTLPPEGVRITPSTASNFAKIVTPNVSDALFAQHATAGWRILAIEITATAQSSSVNYNYGLVRLGREETSLADLPTDIILDRVYIHGKPGLYTQRGVTLNSARTAVIDSDIRDIYWVGTQTQAVGGWAGPGPYKIVNNYLEATGENLMFGGADALISGLIPSDIEVKRNHLNKPLSWRGSGNSICNLFEAKAVKRILFEGNVFTNSWAECQSGMAINLQSSELGSNPWAQTADVTIRYNLIQNANMCAIFNAKDYFGRGVSLARVTFEHNFCDGIGEGQNNVGFQLAGDISDIRITNNTIRHRNTGSGAPFYLNFTGGQRLTITDNIVFPGAVYGPVISDNGMGTAGLTSQFGNTWTFTGNVMEITYQWANPPADNTYITSLLMNSDGSVPAYPGKGADIPTLLSMTKGSISGVWSGSQPPPPPVTPAPTLSLSASPTSVSSGNASTLSWSSSNSTTCTASGGWTGSKGTSGTLSVTPTVNTTYTLTCTGSGGSISQSATVTVTTVVTPPVYPVPTVTFLATPTTVPSGGTTILSWSSTGATFCTATGGWSGSKAISGTLSLTLFQTTTYTLSCTGPGGSASQSTTVSVTPVVTNPVPTLSFTANPTSVSSGQAVILTWVGTNTTSCTASGGWTGSKVTAGNETLYPTVKTTYTLICSGAGGSVTEKETVSILTAVTPPSLPLFSVGQSVETTDKINIRGSASMGGRKLGTQNAFAQGIVVGGPVTGSSRIWWNINYATGVDGWSAQDYLRSALPSVPTAYTDSATLSTDTGVGTLSGSPTTSTLSAQKISVGSWIKADQGVNVRVGPSITAQKYGTQSTGAKGVVIGGPVESDGYRWYNINYSSGVDGWSADSFLSPTTAPTTSTYTAPSYTAPSYTAPKPTTVTATNLPPPTFLTLKQSIMTSSSVNVRASASALGVILGKQPLSSLGTVTSGPVLQGGYTWWYIDFASSYDGWVVSNYLRGM